MVLKTAGEGWGEEGGLPAELSPEVSSAVPGQKWPTFQGQSRAGGSGTQPGGGPSGCLYHQTF